MNQVALRLLNADGTLHPCPESRIGARGIWLFPVNFQSYSEQRPGRVQVLEVEGGVITDTLGLTTPRWRLDIMFGNKPKTINGQRFTAVEVHEDLRRFIGYYFKKRREQLKQRQPLVEMAFDDTYHQRHWYVVPGEIPEWRQSAQEPLRPRLTLSLTGDRAATASTNPKTVSGTSTDTLANRVFPSSISQIGQQMAGYCPVDGASL